MIKLKTAAAAAVLLAAAATPAQAADAEGKWVSGHVNVEVQYDNVLDASDGSESSDLFTTIEPEVTLHITPELSVTAGAVLEPINGPNVGEDRAFEDHGLYLETLVLAYEVDAWGAYAGKFTPVFGLHDYAPGLYGDLFQGDYEFTERLGFGGRVSGDVEGVGTAAFHASLFTADDTVLSESAFNNRGRVQRNLGGFGNAGGVSSVALALDFEPAALDDLVIRAGYVHLEGGVTETTDLNALELGMVYEIAVGDEMRVVPMIDWVRSFDGSIDGGVSAANLVQDIVTTGVAVEYGQWFATVSGGLRFTDDPVNVDPDDAFAQISAGYLFDIGVAVEAGLLGADVDGVETVNVGALVSYGLEF